MAKCSVAVAGARVGMFGAAATTARIIIISLKQVAQASAGANHGLLSIICVNYIRDAELQRRKRSSGRHGDNLLKGSMNQSRMRNVIEHIMSENNEHGPLARLDWQTN